MNITKTWITEPGCGYATGREGCCVEGLHADGSPLSINITPSMIYPRWFQWHADANDGDGFVMHADGSLEGTDDLKRAVPQIFRIAATTPFKRGDFKRIGLTQSL